ncbi:hypothetical protein BN946_scf185014.g115 [Trametes cinnabarina]|uniref:EH domain-containing protein n=1 Tax=Pycnoporus cinnabarinus TaxID=5643 RepID=A0A060SGW7_PYCCI|nr:hypothetical protein BN946_scf185014.g115 [Trametes cinnabarina]
MSSSAVRARVSAFEAIQASNSPRNLLDSPISPAATSIPPIPPILPKPPHTPSAPSPSPSPPNLGRKSSLIDLKDWSTPPSRAPRPAQAPPTPDQTPHPVPPSPRHSPVPASKRDGTQPIAPPPPPPLRSRPPSSRNSLASTSAASDRSSILSTATTECDPACTGALDRDAFVKGMWRIDEELRKAQMGRHLAPRLYVRQPKPTHPPKPILR